MKYILSLLTVVLIVLHYDFWNWASADHMVGGFLPEGLWYHVLFCVAASVLLLMFVVFAWPTHLEDAEPQTPGASVAERYSGH